MQIRATGGVLFITVVLSLVSLRNAKMNAIKKPIEINAIALTIIGFS